MAVSTGTIVSAAVRTATSYDLTGVTVGSGEGIVVVAASRGAMTVSAVEWDSAGVNEGLTQLGSEQDADGTVTLGVWYLAAPTAGASKTVQVTFSGGTKNLIVHAIPIVGMDTTTMVGTPVQTALAGQTAASDNLTDGAVGDLHMSCCAINRINGITWTDGSETEIADSLLTNVEMAVATAAGSTSTTLASDFAGSTVVAQTTFTIFAAAAAAAAGGFPLVGGVGLVGVRNG